MNTNEIILKYLKGNVWEVKKEIYIDSTTYVPIGFITDLASVPRIFWSLYPPYGRYLRAAIIHDYLINEYPLRKDEAHEIFYRIMLEDKVNIVVANIFYHAVKLKDILEL